MKNDSLLSFSIAEKGGPQLTIVGNKKDMVFNWTAITSQVCKELGIPPILLAASMPSMVQEYDKCLSGATRIAVHIPNKNGGGGTP